MKNLIILFLLLLGSNYYSQSGSLEGKITEENSNKGIMGANIRILETELEDLSISNGEYFIRNIPAGEYTVTVKAPMYKSKILENVKLKKDKKTSLNISLEKQNLTDEPAVLQFYKHTLEPEVFSKIEDLKRKDSSAYTEIIKDVLSGANNKSFFYLNKTATEKKNKMHNLEMETKLLGISYKNSSAQRKIEIKNELNDKLNEAFELKADILYSDIKELEKRLAELKKKLDERSKNKEQIIMRRFEELTGNNKYLEW